jgi:ankyrin repeat protein
VVLVFNEPEIGVAKAEILLKAGADVNAQNPSGATVLHEAAEVSDLDLFKTLVEAGADVNIATKHGTTSLMQLHRNEPKIGAGKAEILLKAGANVNAKVSSGRTALHYAAFGSPDLAKTLLVAGADINAVDDHGFTPLALAAGADTNQPVEERVALLKLLLDSGADIRPSQPVLPEHVSIVPLERAAGNSEPEVVRVLLAAGCPVNEGDTYGTTPLMTAARSSTPEIVQVLLEAGADVTRRDDLRGDTALDVARRSKKQAAAEITSMLEAAMKKATP